MAPPLPEFTIICIDNGRRTLYCKDIYHAQLKGARYYCETVLKCNPESRVSIFTMSSKSNVKLVPPTNDLQRLLDALKCVPCHLDGDTDIEDSLSHACSTFSRSPPQMYKRLLVFVGNTLNLNLRDACLYGKKLKESSVALDVFNFLYLKRRPVTLGGNAGIFQGSYHYAKTELEALVTNVNKGNSRIKDIVDEYESSVFATLKFRLHKHVHYLEKKAAAEVEKNKSDADEKNKTAADEKTKSAADDEYGQARAPRARKQKGRKH